MRRAATVVMLGLVLGLTSAVSQGCAGAAPESGGRSDTSVWAEAQDASTVSTHVTSIGLAPLSSQIADAFVDVAEAMKPVPAFIPQRLPAEVSLAPEWWGVVEAISPAYASDMGPNPRIVGGEGGEAEGQLLLDCGDGWLLVVQNFGGDLGDVVGESVGYVSDRPASLYELNGGWLVQWEHEGRWYGLFGRGVNEQSVIDAALGMTLLECY